MLKAVAKLNRLDIAPRKTRSVARIIAGLNVGDAEAELIFRKERASKPILKLLRSAVANAKNAGMNESILFVKEIRVDKGIRLKRWLPRARGMATPIHKDFSNVILVLEENEAKKGKFEILSRPPKFQKTVLKREEEKVVKEKVKKEDKEGKKEVIKGLFKKPSKKSDAKKEEEEVKKQEVDEVAAEEVTETVTNNEEVTNSEVVNEEVSTDEGQEEEKATKESN
jgi:large subunit ribosomal protein L22